MPFFLLSRDDNDGLRLLTPTALPSRQEALAELSRMTSQPDFDAGDGEVLLVDTDAALPVLLVRPAEGVTVEGAEVIAVEVDEPASAPEPVTEVAFAWPLIAEIEPEVAAPLIAPESQPIPAEEAEAFASYVAPAAEAADSTSVSVLADEDTSVPDTFYPVPALAMELEPEPVPIPVDEVQSVAVNSGDIADESVPTLAEAASRDERAEPAEPDDALDDGGLREALDRTASAMAAEAVVAQGEAPTDAKPPRKARLGHKWPWDVATTAVEDAVVAPVGSTAVVEDELVEPPVVDVPVNDMDLAPLGAAAVAGSAVVESLGASVAADDALGEPPVVAIPLDGEITATPLPAPPLEEAAQTLEVEVGGEGTFEAATTIDSPPVASTDLLMPPIDLDAGPAVSSEFLSDLEPIPAQSEPGSSVVMPVAVADAPAPEQDPVHPASLDDYVCADCVYEATCPNKDQRLPKDCGSFQWK